MANKRKTPLKRQPGKRVLNIIYFIDSQATKSIKIPLGIFRLLAVTAFLILAWAGSSTYLGIQTRSKNEALEAELKSLLTDVFEYQTRYEGVYEEAYPLNQRNTTLTQVEQPSSKSSEEISKKEKQDLTKDNPAVMQAANKPKKPDPEKPKPQKPTVDNTILKPQVAAATTGKKPKSDLIVSVDNPLFFKKTNNSFQVQFDLKNNQSPKKAEGYVWAVAKVDFEDGKTSLLSTPQSVNLKTDHTPESKSGLKRFGIRYFKRKKLDFKDIKGKIANVHSVMIGILKSDGSVIKYTISDSIPWKKEAYKQAGLKESKGGLVLNIKNIVPQKM